jgi:hypothetical protein
MTERFELDARMQHRVDRIGAEGAPVIVIDDFLRDADLLVDHAAAQAFAPVTHRAYPGVRAAAPALYLGAVHGFLRAMICEAFGFTGLEVGGSECSYSIVTKRAAELHARQRMPHFDSPETHLIALLHYLCPPAHGGTSFYRHRATGFESLTVDRLAAFDRAINAELGEPQPTGYIDGDTRHFERIAAYGAAFNRMIIYRGAVLHSGNIPADFRADANPRTGRLTLNTFFMFMPRPPAHGSDAR